MTKAVADAKAPLAATIKKEETEISKLKLNEKSMTEQISKVKSDLEK